LLLKAQILFCKGKQGEAESREVTTDLQALD
jgi:hypothetical protein